MKEDDIIIKVPSVGESVSEGVIASWSVKDGQSIKEGSTLFEFETDKATLDVPAPSSGIVKIEVAEGTEVTIGQRVATLSSASAASTDSAPNASSAAASAASTDSAPKSSSAAAPALSLTDSAAAPSKSAAPVVSAPTAASSSTGSSLLGAASTVSRAHEAISPAVRRIAAEHEVDLRTVAGSGKDNRITKGDVLHSLPSVTAPNPAAAPIAPKTVQTPTTQKAASPAAQAPAIEAPRVVPESASDAPRVVPMSRIRQKIAANLVQSKQNAAHLTTFNEVDMTEVIQLRTAYKEDFASEHGIKLGFMSFFVIACCHAAQKFPAVNALLQQENIIYNDSCHIGVALASPKGLIVPVIRSAEKKQFAEIEKEIKYFALAAKEKRLSPDALQGGTFTITNGGIFGSLLSTPIPNPPQTAILGMHAINQRPAVVDGAVVPRPLMYVALTYDHRLIDGKEAVGFLKSIKDSIEEPARLMLHL